MLSINQRIKLIRENFCNDSNQTFANKLTVSKQVANSYIREGYSVGKLVQDKILLAFPEINKVWLLTGEGEMLKSDKPLVQLAEESSEIQKLKEEIKYLKQTIEDKNKIIELYEKMIEK